MCTWGRIGVVVVAFVATVSQTGSATVEPGQEVHAAAADLARVMGRLPDPPGIPTGPDAALVGTWVRSALLVNEWVADHAGSDSNEFVEVLGAPNAGAGWATIVVVDGDFPGNPGRVDAVFPVGTLNGGGYWATAFQSDILNGSLTLLLVSSFSGSVGQDVDADNDGFLDTAPWLQLLDSVARRDGDVGDLAYSASVVSWEGASRVPNGQDTDSTSDWMANDFAGEGLLAGVTGTAGVGEALNTPSWPNRPSAAECYQRIDTSSSAALRATLHQAVDDHIPYGYTDSAWDVWNMVNDAEEHDPGGPGVGTVLEIYENQVHTKIAGGPGVYDPEHSWPNSYGFPDTGDIPYTDGHHIFASTTTYDSARSNRAFGLCDASCTPYVTALNDGQGGGSTTYPDDNTNWQSSSDGGSGIWETWTGRRGDVARALLYLDVRYDGSPHCSGLSEPDLQLTDNTALITTGAPYMGRLSTLLQWHLDDPVDDRERRRAEVIAAYQANRNPFVDHPEWVACVFSDHCEPLFSSGFESGTTSDWTVTVP